jgi:uncharacterized protein (TIGR03435 family)
MRCRFSGAPLSELAQLLGKRLGMEWVRSWLDEPGRLSFRIQPAPILDKTGLTGRYDFTLEYQGRTMYAPEQVPSILKVVQGALEMQLGLTLVKAKVPENVLVIDRLQRLPAEN